MMTVETIARVTIEYMSLDDLIFFFPGFASIFLAIIGSIGTYVIFRIVWKNIRTKKRPDEVSVEEAKLPTEKNK